MVSTFNWCAHFVLLLIFPVYFSEALRCERKRGLDLINKLMIDRDISKFILYAGLFDKVRSVSGSKRCSRFRRKEIKSLATTEQCVPPVELLNTYMYESKRPMSSIYKCWPCVWRVSGLCTNDDLPSKYR